MMLQPQESIAPPFGFNVIGAFGNQSDLDTLKGNFIRMLRDNGHSLSIHDIDPDKSYVGHDQGYAGYAFAGELKYRINLFVMDLFVLVSFLRSAGNLLEDNYLQVALPIWELDLLPPAWAETLEALDAIVAVSRSSQRTFSSHLPNTPTIFAPPPLHLPSFQPSRARFHLPEDAIIFVTGLEPQSDIERTNPTAIIEAFQSAVGNETNAHLVFEISRFFLLPRPHLLVRRLQECSWRDTRIHLVTDAFTEEEVLSLYGACDVFVSLHRAEGLGMGLMQAMALGKPVIATAWSGNMTYMNHTNACLVGFDRVRVEGAHPAYQEDFSEGEAQWAEPDVNEAARWMHLLVHEPALRKTLGEKARFDMARFQAEAQGGSFVNELKTIEKQGPKQSATDT